MTDHESNRPLPVTAAPRTGRRFGSYFGALLLCSAVVAGGYFALRGVTNSNCVGNGEEQEGPIDYKEWKKPLAALVLSGQMHGYVDPCGCSFPQYGGMPRRYNFIESLKAKKWDVVGIDLGELASLEGIHEQRLLKFDLSVKALAAMNYRAFGIGKHEILLPLGDGLAQIWDKNHPYPRPLSLSLAGNQPGGQLHDDLNVRPYEIIDTTKPKIGVISMIWPANPPKNNQQWLNNMTELPKALKAFADAGVEVGVILHHEYPVPVEKDDPFKRMKEIEDKRRDRALECAKFCADARKRNAKIPPILLMMLLTDEPEPPMFLKQLDPKLPTQTIEIGWKGKYVGLIGIYKDSKGYRLQHQNIKIGPDWDSKPGEEAKNPVTALMEKYNQELKRGDMLAKFPRSVHFNQVPAANEKGLRATYVGSASCKECHPHAFKVWSKTDHHLATKTLEDGVHPSGRQFDPDCMKCHTTGFQYPGGYNDPIANLAAWPPPAGAKPDPVLLQKHNEALRGVGCESCHGPSSEHVKNPDNKALYALINPYRPSDLERKLEATPNDPKFKSLFNRRMQDLGNYCMKCHDLENDVHWTETAAKWLGKRIVHRTPVNNNGVGNPGAKIGDPVAPPVIDGIEDKK